MLIQSIRIQNFRSFVDSGEIQLDSINVFTGPNNSGKSSVLMALYQFQQGYGPKHVDVRMGVDSADIKAQIPNPSRLPWLKQFGYSLPSELHLQLHFPNRKNAGAQISLRNQTNGQTNFGPAPNLEPSHFVVPYLSKRKTAGYSEDVRVSLARQVVPNMTHLPAKLSRLSNPGYPNHELYKQKCMEILGFFVTSVSSEQGQHVGAYLPDGESIFIDSMGEGVANIVSLLADLVVSKGRVFLIEEPENDLHPKALKALLDMIIESSAHNQFFISSHSNIVVRYLASTENSKLFKVCPRSNEQPTETLIEEVERTAEARLEVLRELGYSFSDFDLWDGWLILEESSAERIIRDYLIPWFAPGLSRIRTLSASGVDKVEPVFEDYNRLVRYTHLEEAYRNSAWVVVDGDAPGNEVVARLKSGYGGWDESRFRTLNQPRFEDYYPAIFRDATEVAFKVQDRRERMNAKRELLNSVLNWTKEDPERAKSAFRDSAKEIIDILKEIEATLT